MLRRITAISLIVALLVSNLSMMFVYAGFEMNRKYIAAKLCENRNRPILHCNGKCYLAKKLKQAEEKEKKQERESVKGQFQEAFIAQNNRIVFSSHILQVITTRYIQPVAIAHQTNIFQPPRSISVS